MPTDTERREVARRLRDKKAECEERGYPWMCDDLVLALGYDHDYEAGDEIFDRLADLIEPPARCPHYHSGRHYCSVHEEMALIDRDALLALADQMDAHWLGHGGVEDSPVARWSRELREALGEAE